MWFWRSVDGVSYNLAWHVQRVCDVVTRPINGCRRDCIVVRYSSKQHCYRSTPCSTPAPVRLYRWVASSQTMAPGCDSASILRMFTTLLQVASLKPFIVVTLTTRQLESLSEVDNNNIMSTTFFVLLQPQWRHPLNTADYSSITDSPQHTTSYSTRPTCFQQRVACMACFIEHAKEREPRGLKGWIIS